MSKKKIINDPVYGFISFPYEILYDLIDHPYFQRLRRIAQMGLSHYVYPGALHTRFHHALGSLHLTTQAISVLREKGIAISDEEAEAVSIAILLHDIGHGPFSHALEGTLIDVSHETISLSFMKRLNEEFNGKLQLAIEIFQGKYHRPFFNQLVSSQLDMDRMDYLTRDSFFSGVAEGVISYDRIIKMLNVREDRLVVEEKGVFSIEKFLLSRKLMYWQVYLHKTSIISEQILIRFVIELREYLKKKSHIFYSEELGYFLKNEIRKADYDKEEKSIIDKYALIDDYDVYCLIKKFHKSEEFGLRFLASSLLNRKLFKIELRDQAFSSDEIKSIRLNICKTFKINEESAKVLIIQGMESNIPYRTDHNEINILYKDGRILPFSLGTNQQVQNKRIKKFFVCYPKEIVKV